MTADQITTFQTVSGVSAADLSLAIRTSVGAVFFIWALWMSVSCFHHLRKGKGSVFDIKIQLLRVCLSLMVGLLLISSGSHA